MRWNNAYESDGVLTKLWYRLEQMQTVYVVTSPPRWGMHFNDVLLLRAKRHRWPLSKMPFHTTVYIRLISVSRFQCVKKMNDGHALVSIRPRLPLLTIFITLIKDRHINISLRRLWWQEMADEKLNLKALIIRQMATCNSIISNISLIRLLAADDTINRLLINFIGYMGNTKTHT